MGKWLVKEKSIGVAFSDMKWPKDDIVIINYEILIQPCRKCRGKAKEVKKACTHCKGTGKFSTFPELFDIEWDYVIADEIHNIKNGKTSRCQGIMKLKSKHNIALTGTPIQNKPIEIFTTLNWLDEKVWGNWWSFASRYCAMVRDRFGLHTDGASHLDELQYKLRAGLMIRRLKMEVLKELPPKFRQVIELPVEGLEGAIEEEWSAYNKMEETLKALRIATQIAKTSENDGDYHNAVTKLKEGQNAAFQEMAKIRVEIAKKKLPYAIGHIKETLEEGNKVICFAHHHVVVEAIAKAFPKSAIITGKVDVHKRDAEVKRFQNDPTCMLFIGNIKAAGVGLTLTASSKVIFCELDWVPANLTQAEDRAHRHGQKDNVLVQHLVLEGSLDSVMAKRIISKQKVIDMALDSYHEPEEELFDLPDDSEVKATTRKEVVEKSVTLSDYDCDVILEGLRIIASLCDGAASLDGHGFSKMDANIGIEFSRRATLSKKQAYIGLKLCKRYRKQLSEDMNEKIGLIV